MPSSASTSLSHGSQVKELHFNAVDQVEVLAHVALRLLDPQIIGLAALDPKWLRPQFHQNRLARSRRRQTFVKGEPGVAPDADEEQVALELRCLLERIGERRPQGRDSV